MTGPTSAAQLLVLAATELEQLQRQAQHAQAADPHALAAAWPAFQHAAERLVHALEQPPAGATPGPAPSVPAGSIRPEPHLHRAADLLGAAADLVATRDRRHLSNADRAADAAHVRRHLAAAAQLVVHATVSEPALVTTLAAAATASVRTTTTLLGRAAATASARSLADASTGLSHPHSADGAAPLLSAVHRWQTAAIDVATQPAPAREDLHQAAGSAAWLLGTSHRLLRAHAGSFGTDQTLTATIERIRAAGHAWNAAHDGWDLTSTGGPRTQLLPQATAGLDRTLTPLLERGTTSSPELARAVIHGVLAAVQAVADAHAPLVARLAQTGALHAQAHTLPVPQRAGVDEPDERIEARLSRRWVPLDPKSAAQVDAAYARLPQATADVRLAYAALTADSQVTPPVTRVRRATVAIGPALVDQAAPVPHTLAGSRWSATVAAVDPRLLADPHYPALAAALDRVQLAGDDPAASLRRAAATAGPLPDEHAARTLHSRLVDVCPSAITPYTFSSTPPGAPARVLPDLTSRPSPAVPAGPRR